MTRAQFFAKVEANQADLRLLIDRYTPGESYNPEPLEITAPNPEAACQMIRGDIAKERQGKPPPAREFDIALANRDSAAIVALLSSAWCGVPESTACWRIPGFAAACDLLDDPIDDGDTEASP